MSSSVESVKLVAGGDAAEVGHKANAGLKEPLFKRLLRIVFPDQRKQQRVSLPPLVGYLGTMRATKPYEIGDISSTGFSLMTHERWETGTEMPITLLRTNVAKEAEADSFTVQATVVRSGQSGVGFSIVLSEEQSNAVYGNRIHVRWASKPEMEGFLKRMSGEQDSAPVRSDAAQTERWLYLDGRQTVLTHSAGD